MSSISVKRYMIAGVAVALLAVVALPSVVSQQLTTVAVVDVQRVYNAITRYGVSTERISAIQAEYQEQIDVLEQSIRNLQQERTNLSNTAVQRRQEIDNEIRRLTREINTTTRNRNNDISAARRQLSPSDIVAPLQRAIIYVAESEGYTIVFRSDSEGIQWWSNVVDISQSVVDRLIIQLYEQ